MKVAKQEQKGGAALTRTHNEIATIVEHTIAELERRGFIVSINICRGKQN